MTIKSARQLIKVKPAVLILGIIAICVSFFEYTAAQSLTTRKIADGVFLLESPINEDQLVMTSEKGLVVFNTFWPSMIAQKDEISKAFNRDDFYLAVNMVDRLDMLGGNAAYKETTIIGHKSLLEKYNAEKVDAEINELLDTWRWKENVSRERLATHEPGSEEEENERRWMNTCKQRADELEKGFSLVLPTVVYDDRKTLDLGDMTLELIWFGRAGKYIGMTIAVVPEAKLAVIPSFIMHPHHLAPHPHHQYAALDVPRWISVLGEILEGTNPVDKVICGINEVWARERALTHLKYIRKLWNEVEQAESEGKDLHEIQDQFSLDNEFAFVKEMPGFQDRGDDWFRPQHRFHVRNFYLQHKNMASEILRKEPENSLRDATARIRTQRDDGGDVYFDETSINWLGYELMNASRFTDAIDVLKLNVEAYPRSANAYDSLAEAYMKGGDTKKAIANYKKSLELNPENDNAKEMLKNLKKE